MKTTVTSIKIALILFAAITVFISQTKLTSASDYQNPRVVTSTPSDLSELPRTGIPLAAWALGALAPMGLRFLKGKKTEKVEESSPNSIWTSRQLNK